MKEDIKILEEEKSVMKKDNRFWYEIPPEKKQKLAQAIENLIKGYRELEEKIKRYKRYLENKDKKFEEALEYEYQERETDYIPKSKIKEKIEEYTNSILENLDEDRRWCDMEIVDNFERLKQELLGDEK